MATDCVLDGSEFETIAARYGVFSTPVQMDLVADTASREVDIEVLSRGSNSRDMALSIHPDLEPRFKKE
jgi:hypothetical protein